MHFQLLFPGKTSNAGSCLRSVGLADFVAGCTEMPVASDKPGLLVAWGNSIGLDPANQRVIDSGEGYDVIFSKTSPCTPAELARSSLFNGYDVDLSDGQNWRVPLAADLPKTMKLVGKDWRTVRKPQFDEYWQRSEVWFRRFLMQDLDEKSMLSETGMTAQELHNEWMDFCIFCLRQNYRLTPLIASELSIIDTDDLLKITLAAIDGMAIKEVMEEAAKKAERESAGSKKEAA